MTGHLASPATLDGESRSGFTATFATVPEAITEGENRADALANAVDASESALSFYVDDK